jgi:tetratricopeptide (TPR) repeat protein
MRLLCFNQLKQLVLTDFRNKTIPPYAILSHRWGDAEILLEDIRSGAYKEKKDGYRKLQFCAERAAQDKLQYFWIDTCCIDKWNLWERSRAINSMFLWYKNATRCYVFLSDVSVPTTTLQRSQWEASFRASAWFTRGWTLQELIAPVSVGFFSCEGRQIGDKMSLDQLVHEITSIPLAALRNDSLDQFTTSERSRWSENRETTEEEDIVYCLLGVLDVSMPTSYGEGRESASRRLQAEVEAASGAPCIIPFSQNDCFVGRELQLAELEVKLFSDRLSTILAIVGPRGTGKSQLALELAHRTRQKNKNRSVFWVDASNKDNLYQSYASIAQKLSIPGWDDEKADLTLLVKRRLADSSARQCLLIFDNAEDISLGSSGSSTAQAADLLDYLPQSELCSIIFTTTNSNTARTLASQNVVEVRELAPDVALRMLDKYLSTPISQSEEQEAKLLLQELSYLPMAIVQAAAYMNARSITLQNYRSELARHKHLGLKHSSNAPKDPLRGSNARSPVTATLGLSLDEVRRSNALAADYLFLAACIARKDILLDLLDTSSTRAREDAVKILSRYALVTRRPAESALDLHSLVHSALREWLEQQGLLLEWTQQATKQLLQVFPEDEHVDRSKWRRLLPHSKYALLHSPAEDNKTERLSLMWKSAMALYSDGRYKEAEELFMQVIEARKRVLGEEHPYTLTSMGNLAATYRSQGRWKEAEELEVQVIETEKRVLGEEHPDTLTSMANLAGTYWNQGRWKEAEELGVQIMVTMKRVFGDKHPDTLTSMANLAETYWKQGRWKEAFALTETCFQQRKQILGEQHPYTQSSLNTLNDWRVESCVIDL